MSDASATNVDCDVLVVGSGASGLTAAIVAKHHGLDVRVVEKQPHVGGCSAYSHGMLWMPGNPVAARTGIADDRDAALTYLRGEMGAAFEAARPEIEAYLDHGPRMVEFLEQNCGLRFELRQGFPDYRSERPGAAQSGRTILPSSYDARVLGRALRQLQPPRTTLLGMSFTPSENRLISARLGPGLRYLGRRFVRHLADLALHGRTAQLAGGNALMAGLLKAAIDRDVPIHTRTQLRSLAQTDGRVSGATLESEGRALQVHARRGVVLACGGFGQDIQRCANSFGHPPLHGTSWSLAPAGCDGDGLRMAMELGAAIEPQLTNAAFWVPVSRLPEPGGMLSTHSHDRFRPGFIAVDPSGQRFANEADSNHHFCEALLRATPPGSAPSGWIVCDRQALMRNGLGDVIYGAPFPLKRHLQSGYLLERERLDALARAMGIDPVGFCRMVERYNDAARRGEDPDFGKGNTRFNRSMGSADQPHPCLRPLEHGPFYAVRFSVGHMATLIGLRADLEGRALDGAGEPIPGLYLTGNDRVNLFRGACPGGGITLGPGMTWSYLTARHLAGASSPASTAAFSKRNPFPPELRSATPCPTN